MCIPMKIAKVIGLVLKSYIGRGMTLCFQCVEIQDLFGVQISYRVINITHEMASCAIWESRRSLIFSWIKETAYDIPCPQELLQQE